MDFQVSFVVSTPQNCILARLSSLGLAGRDVTFLDHRRSVGTPRQWRHIFGSKDVSWGPASVMSRFWIKRGQLGPRVSDVTFLDQGGQLGPCVSDVTFLDQRRSVGAPRQWRHVFGSMEVSWTPLLVFGWFPWFFKVVSWFFMVFGWFPWFFKVVSWFFMVSLQIVPARTVSWPDHPV